MSLGDYIASLNTRRHTKAELAAQLGDLLADLGQLVEDGSVEPEDLPDWLEGLLVPQKTQVLNITLSARLKGVIREPDAREIEGWLFGAIRAAIENAYLPPCALSDDIKQQITAEPSGYARADEFQNLLEFSVVNSWTEDEE